VGHTHSTMPWPKSHFRVFDLKMIPLKTECGIRSCFIRINDSRPWILDLEALRGISFKPTAKAVKSSLTNKNCLIGVKRRVKIFLEPLTPLLKNTPLRLTLNSPQTHQIPIPVVADGGSGLPLARDRHTDLKTRSTVS